MRRQPQLQVISRTFGYWLLSHTIPLVGLRAKAQLFVGLHLGIVEDEKDEFIDNETKIILIETKIIDINITDNKIFRR